MTTTEFETEVKKLLPLITPYTVPDAASWQVIYQTALDNVMADLFGLNDVQVKLAVVYYIAHLMSSKDGRMSITSEHLGQWSASYGTGSAPDQYYAEYLRIVDGAKTAAIIRGSGIVTHDDATCADRYRLDGSRDGGCRYDRGY